MVMVDLPETMSVRSSLTTAPFLRGGLPMLCFGLPTMFGPVYKKLDCIVAANFWCVKPFLPEAGAGPTDTRRSPGRENLGLK